MISFSRFHTCLYRSFLLVLLNLLPKRTVLFYHVCMYGTFAYSKFFGSSPHSGFILENIISQLNGPFFHDALQINPSTYFFVSCVCGRIHLQNDKFPPDRVRSADVPLRAPTGNWKFCRVCAAIRLPAQFIPQPYHRPIETKGGKTSILL